ncbi:MAG: hypothetical protein ACFFCO_10355 [Promethearchaeota archaeon]
MADSSEDDPGAKPCKQRGTHLLSESLLGNGFEQNTLAYFMKD